MILGVAHRAVPGDGPLVVRTVVQDGARPVMRWDGSELIVAVDGGERVRIVIDDDTAFPPRTVRDRWRTLRDHVAAPAAEIDPQRKALLRGFWICEGDRVAVDGVPLDEGRVRARAIGAGTDARGELASAIAIAAQKASDDDGGGGIGVIEKGLRAIEHLFNRRITRRR